MKEQPHSKKTGLSVLDALRYFLKGNYMFVVSGLVAYVIGDAISLLPPLFQQVFTDSIITHKNPEWFMPLVIIYILLFVLELAAWISLSIQRKKDSAKLGITMSSRYLWSVLRLPMAMFARFSPGELVARYTSNAKTIRFLEFALPSVAAFLIPVISCSLIMLFNWKLGIVVVSSVLLLLYVIRTTSKLQKRKAMDMDVTESRLQNITMTGMSNLETIKSMGGEQFFFSQWDETYVQAMNARVKTSTITIFISSVPLLVLHLTNALILCLGAWYILRGELTPGMLLASQGLVNESIWPLNKTIDAMMLVMRVNSSIKRIKDVTDCNRESSPLYLSADDELPDVAKLTGEIELRDVTFGYDRSLPPILSHFSLKIKPGERIALVGSSGCGKSTILSLISGLYEPWDGEVLFDGKPRKAIDRLSFINSVSVVNQDVTLFEGTIADNVKMWDESIEDFAMVLACNDAQIHQEIMERPGAYQSTVAENGKNFSGGQRQRIEIATALAKEPTILLMDEGTSALDQHTEAKVMESIYSQGMTLVMIAHRLETIAGCDQIYVIEQGRVTQHGTHDELRQMEGLYSNLLKYA
ncbi:MAG: ATP-binding cassette domain-containing protein [Prevotella sp.]|nr:ATP-binding cassette domain-containing protein [Prevotella sp.]